MARRSGSGGSRSSPPPAKAAPPPPPDRDEAEEPRVEAVDPDEGGLPVEEEPAVASVEPEEHRSKAVGPYRRAPPKEQEGIVRRMLRFPGTVGGAGYRFLRDTIQTPGQFVALVLVLVSLVYLSANYLVFGIAFALVLWFGLVWVSARERAAAGRRIPKTEVAFFTAIMLVLTATAALYVDAREFEPATLPSSVVEPVAKNGWVGGPVPGAFEAPSIPSYVPVSYSIYGYATTADPRYIGFFVIGTVKARVGFTEDGMAEYIDERIFSCVEDGSLRIQRGTRQVRYVETEDGHRATLWTYEAETRQGESRCSPTGTFDGAAKVKVIGGTWACKEKGVFVGVAGGAAWGSAESTSGVQGKLTQSNWPDNLSTWLVLQNLVREVRC